MTIKDRLIAAHGYVFDVQETIRTPDKRTIRYSYQARARATFRWSRPLETTYAGIKVELMPIDNGSPFVVAFNVPFEQFKKIGKTLHPTIPKIRITEDTHLKTINIYRFKRHRPAKRLKFF